MMDSEHEELYLNKLKRFIFDENQIVTTIWLSKTLKLDIKACTQLLNQFVSDEKDLSKLDKIGVSYIVTGKIDDKNTFVIIKDQDLEIKRKLFQHITSENVYSIQRSKDVNFNSLELVDMFDLHGDSAPILGCPVSTNCVKRENLRTDRILPPVSRAVSCDKSKASHLFSGVKANVAASALDTDAKIVKKESEAKKEEQVAKKKDEKKLERQKSNEKDKAAKNGNSISNMFSAMSKKASQEKMEVDVDVDADKNGDKEEKPASKPVKSKPVEPKPELDLYDSSTDEEAKKIEEKNKAKKKKNKDSSSTPSSSSKKRKSSSSKRERHDKSMEQHPQKKRKRIVEHVESDEDMFASNEEAEDKSVDVIESDNEPVYEKPKVLAKKNRKRKLVDKTFLDDDGYVVTKREWVYDSKDEGGDDEDDDEQKNKENPPNIEPVNKPKVVTETATVTKKKKTSPKDSNTKGKKPPAKPDNQPTLFSFFSKK